MSKPLPNAVLAQLAKLTQQAGPLLLALVGPNGAGKSTFYQQYLASIKLPFINADLLAKTLIAAGAPEGESTERLAADLAEKRRREMIAKRENFITETVFSDPVGEKVQSLREAQAAGYSVVMIFICVESAELSALRVESRVQDGGHSVPLEKIGLRLPRFGGQRPARVDV
jgi:predicted ABC-type ATPase